ncbi:TrbM/KikA/MpfK family conjugal transfer protein [Metapseudomonas furukawaii]|uniref:TrbM/KikA/MpfK family conjugal transfer protein n=1 Tax=Metapseudomonas furukawaii TaxID=1149133 RepID=UPI00056A6077|nr:TrbM/KikA/MpfK family conjugal transfer protein [Pseudomonas furukawaii]
MNLKRTIAAFAVVWAVGTSPASYAGDPCKTVICMWGLFSGTGVSGGCKGAVADYFSIVRYRKKKINWNATSDARSQFLNSCPSADRGFTRAINGRFGKSSG